MAYPIDIISKAKELRLQGVPFETIAKQLNIKQYQSIMGWEKKYHWRKDKTAYATDSIKIQIDRCLEIIEKIEPELKEINILNPSKTEKILLMHFHKFSNLHLKLIKQLTCIKPISKVPTSKNIFD